MAEKGTDGARMGTREVPHGWGVGTSVKSWVGTGWP